jgi:hypothetical protein
MANVKLKSDIKKDREGADETEEQIFPIAHTPTRREESEKRLRAKEFGGGNGAENYEVINSDLKPLLDKLNGTIVSQRTYLPQQQGDAQTLSADDLNKEREQRNVSRNRFTNTTYYWH